MIISTITQQGRNLSCDIQSIPAQFSVDLEFKLIKDSNYTEYVVTPYCAYSQNKFVECESDLKVYPLVIKDAIFKVPKEILNRSGYLIIAISLSSNNEVFQTLPIVYKIQASIGGTDVLPEDIKSWQQLVIQTVDDRIALTFTKPMNDLIEEAKKQQEVSNTLQEDTRAIINSTISSVEEMNVKINNSISNLGQYEIISKDPTKVKFKKGNGKYGEIVDLGTDLASKSLVNAGYEIASGNTYSGASSECGINVTEIEGKYEQASTNGYQLIDFDDFTKTDCILVDKNKGEVRSNIINKYYCSLFSTKLKELLMANLGKYITFKVDDFKSRDISVVIYGIVNNASYTQEKTSISKSITMVIKEDFTSITKIEFRFNRLSNPFTDTTTVFTGLIAYLGNDSKSFETFTGVAPSPNPEFPQEPKFVDIKEFNSHTRNLFDVSKFPSKTQSGVTFKNNGDGSFTISGSGALTSAFSTYFDYTHEEVKQLLKKGILKSNHISPTYPYCYISFWIDGLQLKEVVLTANALNFEITEEMLNNQTFKIRIGFYSEANKTIVANTIKPILYQEGDGTFERFKLETTTLEKPLQLLSLPNGVCDAYENGVITRRVGKVVINETSNITKNMDAANNFLYYIRMLNENFKQINTNIVANNLKTKNLEEINKGSEKTSLGVANNGGTAKVIYFNIGYYLSTNTVAAVKEYLQTHPITVYYELDTPIIEQFSIPILPSYYPNTVIQHDSQIDTKSIIWHVNSYAVGKLDNLKLKKLTQSEYNNLANKDDMTLYVVVGV